MTPRRLCDVLRLLLDAAAVDAALDFAVGRCRERLGELYQSCRALRREVHWYRHAVERFDGRLFWESQLALLYPRYALSKREWREFSRLYRVYRRLQNRRWGLPDDAVWYALPAYARRGCRSEGL